MRSDGLAAPLLQAPNGPTGLRVCCDTGGTFTDLLVEEADCRLRLYKSPTTPADPSTGILNALSLAAQDREMPLEAFLASVRSFIHGTTHAVNAIVTGNTARTALLVNSGHPDILSLREGGRVDPFDHRIRYPAPYIPRRLTFEVPGRIDSQGIEIAPLGENALLHIAKMCRAEGVEAIAVCLLWSIANPAHERSVREILGPLLPGLAITLSHELNPSIREYRRAISTAIDASLKPVMSSYLGRLEQRLRRFGLVSPILIVGSDGHMTRAADAARTPIRTVNSGPAMAPVSGRYYAALEGFRGDVIVADTGGTTFDVSVVRHGEITTSRETWLGRPYSSDITGFPSLEIRSIGAGGGSIAWIDANQILHVGPRSAGAMPGPACFGQLGREATVTDAALVLGWIDPAYFLGGTLPLDLEAARRAIDETVARPLRLSVEAAALAIIEVVTEGMIQAIQDMTTHVGIDPAGAALVGGGGAIGINAALLLKRLGCRALVLPDVGAALSAGGGLISAVGSEYRRPLFVRTDQASPAGLREGIAWLDAQAAAFFDDLGIAAEDREGSYSVEARYAGQSWEIEVPLQGLRFEDAADLGALVRQFHDDHQRVFSVRDPGCAVEILGIILRVRTRAAADEPRRRLVGARTRSRGGRRPVCLPGHADREADIVDVADLRTDTPLQGPAVIETPFTSIVLLPRMQALRTANGSIVVRATTQS